MATLLVIKPDGTQGVVEVNYSGGYYDDSKVIWDERIDGKSTVTIIPGAMVRVGDMLTVDDMLLAEVNANNLAASKTLAITSIDADSDKVVSDAIGRRDTEYLMAEAQATAYIDAGYVGDTYPYVRSWAIAKGSTDQWAADDIAATASAWRTAQISMRSERLKDKELVRVATSIAEVDGIMTLWRTYISSLRSTLGI